MKSPGGKSSQRTESQTKQRNTQVTQGKKQSINVGHYQLGEFEISYYIIGAAVGSGTFGEVKLGKHILTGEKVAVKKLEKDKIKDMADVERVAREIHILKLIRHPHIIQLYEIIETSKELYLIMEYASGGELFDYIVAKGKVREAEACKFF